MSESSRGAEIVDSVVTCRWDWWVEARAELIRRFDEALDEMYARGLGVEGPTEPLSVEEEW